MKKSFFALAGAAALTVGLTASANAALIAQPGETMGLAFGAPLPEGVFFVDLEDYGGGDNSNNRLGVNIPVVVWSTPFSFYDTRLEFLYAAPFIHQDSSNPGGPNRVDFYSQLFSPILAHDFGNGFNASLLLGVRTPDVQFHSYTGADIRAGLSYVANGFNLSATFYYNGTFGGHTGGANPFTAAGPNGAADAVDVDFTATKKFGKLEVGFVGFAVTDINNRGDNTIGLDGAGNPIFRRTGIVGVGGLVGYDFGKFTLQGMVTRQVANRAGNANDETRGWLRLIVPLYVAPTPPKPIMARY